MGAVLRTDEVTPWMGGDESGPWCCYCGVGREDGACECLAAVLVAAVHAELGRFHDSVDTADVVAACIADLGGDATAADAIAWVMEARENAERAYHRENHYPARDGA